MTQLDQDKARIAELKKARGIPSKTNQSFKKSHNINTIMAEFYKTGIMPLLKENPGLSQINPSNGLNYHQQMNIQRSYKQSFYDGSFQPDIPAKTIYRSTKGTMPFNP